MARLGAAAWRRLAAGLARGVVMGCADVVPGVSGGTMAVALGIYERLLAAARRIAAAAALALRLRRSAALARLAEVDWWLVVPLLCGIGATVVLAAPLIETQLEQRPETMAGLFCGLIGASALVACRLFEWRRVRLVAIMAASAGLTFALLGLQSEPVSDPSLPVLAGAGALAVCAMILPGISGAFVLLMLGMYGAVITIISDIRLLEASVFVAGAAVGLALFATVLGRLLEVARDIVLAVIVGLMAGSLRVLWPWPDGVGVISRHSDEAVSGTGLAWPGADEWFAPALAAAAGFVIVLAVSHISTRREPR